MRYTLGNNCPFCGTMFFPTDTFAGSPFKDEQSQKDMAEAYLIKEQLDD